MMYEPDPSQYKLGGAGRTPSSWPTSSSPLSQEPLFKVAVEKLKGMMGVLEEVLEKMKDRPELIIKIFVAVK